MELGTSERTRRAAEGGAMTDASRVEQRQAGKGTAKPSLSEKMTEDPMSSSDLLDMTNGILTGTIDCVAQPRFGHQYY